MTDSIQDEIAQLRACEDKPDLPDVEERLRQGLASENHRIAERAATIAGEQKRAELEGDMRTAYERFLNDPLATDRGCLAKTALCDALRHIEHDDGDFFLRGIHYVQLEPGYGGSTDAAARLRAICGFALVQLSDSRALDVLVDLLADTEITARAGAARAIAHAGGPASELLLRLKIHLGDSSPEVMGECFSGLLRLNPKQAIPRVADFLGHQSEDLGCEAALALGESRNQEAFPLLKKQAQRKNGRDYEGVLLTSIGLLSLPEAVDYLQSVVASPDVSAAGAAIRALSHCRDPQAFRERLSQVVRKTRSRKLNRIFAEEFS